MRPRRKRPTRERVLTVLSGEMFYDATANDHGLPHDPFKQLVAPRPIGWISTRASNGVLNLAPYSFFNAVSEKPHIVVFGSSGYKDTVTNIAATGEFVCNLATYDLRGAVNETSAVVAPDVDEFVLAGLTPEACRLVGVPRVAESPVALECRHLQTVRLQDLDGKSASSWLVIGQVVGVHIDDRCIRDGLVQMSELRPIARLGYRQYCVVDEVFEMVRPGTG